MGKKKKTQLKPVARGFATVSVPKKAVPAEMETPGTPDSVVIPSASGVTDDETGKEDVVSTKKSTEVPDELDPDKVEEQSLQNLVDRLQEKTEKEIVRYVHLSLTICLNLWMSYSILELSKYVRLGFPILWMIHWFQEHRN